jgi:hypothetical protein
MKKKQNFKQKQEIGGISFMAAGMIVILVPEIFFIVLGDFTQLISKCTMPFGSVDIGNNMVIDCTQLRFVYVLSFFCLLLGLILIILGLAKKIIEQKSLKKP